MERTDLRASLVAGLAAGVAGAIVIDLAIIAFGIAGGATALQALTGFAVFTASAVLGPAGVAGGAIALPLGLAIHLAVSLAWAFGYVYLVRSQPQLLTRPLVSGLVFGLVVYIVMSVMLITAGLYHRPSPRAFEQGLIENLVCFGVPVALVVSRMLRRA